MFVVYKYAIYSTVPANCYYFSLHILMTIRLLTMGLQNCTTNINFIAFVFFYSSTFALHKPPFRKNGSLHGGLGQGNGLVDHAQHRVERLSLSDKVLI